MEGSFYFVESVREPVPSRPWYVEPYGYSLATVRGADGESVIDTLNIALAEFIVAAVNKENNA